MAEFRADAAAATSPAARSSSLLTLAREIRGYGLGLGLGYLPKLAPPKLAPPDRRQPDRPNGQGALTWPRRSWLDLA